MTPAMASYVERMFDTMKSDSSVFAPRLPLGRSIGQMTVAASPTEPKGAVYTRPWVVELILDLVGYRPEADLGGMYAVEPSAGGGAFLAEMAPRLIRSLRLHSRPLDHGCAAIRAFEVDGVSAAAAIETTVAALVDEGVSEVEARRLAESWVTIGDYLLESDRPADVVVGNPPYIRYDDLPRNLYADYQAACPTMIGRCDIYVGFIEAGIRHLKPEGMLGFICADRWMRSAYGAELRRFVADECGVEAVIEMHDAPAFEDDVAAYPAVIALRRGDQKRTLMVHASADAGPLDDDRGLADALDQASELADKTVPGFTAARLDEWFTGGAPWPSLQPAKLSLLRHLEERFAPLEDRVRGTKVGIGVATGNDSLFVVKPGADVDVEPDRLLPLALVADTRSGTFTWSGHRLIDPWDGDGLVNLNEYPKLSAYFDQNREALERRNVASKNPRGWYRTIDRVNHDLLTKPKLLFPDMKVFSNPTLDSGATYPHHNLYYLVSDVWDLEVLGGLLMSKVAQLFIEAYCIKMRGGTLRFQAQYLRRIRVPDPTTISPAIASSLIEAFRIRNAGLATEAAIEAYGISDQASLLSC